ncbi:MAG TPA: toprim domain-containing protein [Cyclobacteriaceae bacterium]|nr:toprim domain-containing protein [Cyclobacteriaceae bacterium]
MNYDSVKEDVIERWPGVFKSLGIDVGDGRHTSCPICKSGKDRFRMDNKDGKGTWFCNQCGAGDGWALVQKVLGIDFKEALSSVSGIIGTIPKSKVLQEPSMTKEKMREIFNGSKIVAPGDPVYRYLTGRGLNKIPANIRYHPAMWEEETKRKQKAMLTVFMGADNIALTMHRTYLDADGNKLKIEKSKKMLPVLRKMNGGACRLFPLDERKKLGIAEGIETAIAASEYFGVPVWAATNANMLECFEPPNGLRELLIFGDNDQSYTGQKSAYVLANKAIVQKKIPNVSVHIPDVPGEDWADVVVKQKHARAA